MVNKSCVWKGKPHYDKRWACNTYWHRPKKLEDLREDALFEDRDEDAAKYETEIILLRAAIRRGEQYQVNF